MTPNDQLEFWTIYDHPSDYPEHFVVRCYYLRGAVALSSAEVKLAATLEEARRFIPREASCVGRDPTDLPVVVETWIN